MAKLFTSRPTFASAMGLFTKAQDELKAAQEINEAELLEAEEKVRACQSEGGKISNAMAIFDKLLGTGVETKK